MLLDSLGALSSLAATYFFVRVSSKAWLISLLAIAINGFLYWQKGIYADTGLQGLYFIMTCYGWLRWEGNTKCLIIRSLSYRQWFILGGILLALFAVIDTLLIKFTPSTIPSLDALTSTLSIVAEALMCYKIIATWLLWLVTDLLYAYLYAQKALPVHVAVMLIYTTMAMAGFYSWRRKAKITVC